MEQKPGPGVSLLARWRDRTRTSPRWPARAEVRVGGADGGDAQSANAVDISRGGMLLAPAIAAAEGDRVFVDAAPCLQRVAARVVFQGEHGTGLQFDSPIHEDDIFLLTGPALAG